MLSSTSTCGGSASRAEGGGNWFNIGGSPSHKRWHVTVFYRARGLSVTVLNSRTHLARRLCRSGQGGLAEILRLASKSKDITVLCRRAWYKDPDSPYKGQKIAWTDDTLIVKPATLDRASRESCATMFVAMLGRLVKDRRWRTELQVVQEIPRKELLAKSAEAQIASVAKPLVHLYPILKHLLER